MKCQKIAFRETYTISRDKVFNIFAMEISYNISILKMTFDVVCVRFLIIKNCGEFPKNNGQQENMPANGWQWLLYLFDK